VYSPHRPKKFQSSFRSDIHFAPSELLLKKSLRSINISCLTALWSFPHTALNHTAALRTYVLMSSNACGFRL
jgi:hypothetical protein